MKLESLLQYLDGYLGVSAHPDYKTALNGLQVGDAAKDVRRIAAAVDGSEEAVARAIETGADLLLVHHGLFWSGLQPLTGRLLRKVRPLLAHDVALYSVHLPLDSHAEVGNSAVLGRALGLDLKDRFARYGDTPIGWWGATDEFDDAEGLRARLSEVLDGPVHLVAGGPERVERVGVVTGGGASFLAEAAALGLDALVTGEGSHHSHFDATELGVHLLFGGHYATETFGVRALARHLAERFDLTWEFLDLPTGL